MYQIVTFGSGAYMWYIVDCIILIADLFFFPFFVITVLSLLKYFQSHTVEAMLQVGAHVVTDLCIVKDSDPIPMGFIAIDYTADTSMLQNSYTYIPFKMGKFDNTN